jgi:hypothetical protein
LLQREKVTLTAGKIAREAALTAGSLPAKIDPSESWACDVEGTPEFTRFFARFNQRA